MDLPNSPNTLVPLTLLALEIGVTADELAAQFGDDVTTDDTTGLRCVGAERSRAHLAAVRAAQQAQADRAAQRQAEFSRQYDAEYCLLMKRIAAIQARPTTGNPFADVLIDHLEGRLDHAAAEREELLRSQHTGGLQYHPFREKD